MQRLISSNFSGWFSENPPRRETSGESQGRRSLDSQARSNNVIMNNESYFIISVPSSSALMSYGTFLQNAEKIASIIDVLIQSDPEIADRSFGLKMCNLSDLCGDLLREHALKMVRAMCENNGTTFTETNSACAETFCIFAGCGMLVPVPDRSYFGLAAPEVIPTATVKQSVLRLLESATVETHPDEIIPAIGREALFETLEDLGALSDQCVKCNSNDDSQPG